MKCPHGVEALTPREGEPSGVFPCWFCLVPNGSSDRYVDIQHNPSIGSPATRLVNPGWKPDPKTDRITFLERKRETTKADLLVKFEDGDWHGVQDCGSDLRDIESELKGLRY